MRKYESLAFSAATALTLFLTASCQKEIFQTSDGSASCTVEFSMNEMATKTAMGDKDVDNKYPTVWSSDDNARITFYQNGIASESVAISSADNYKHASFTASFSEQGTAPFKYKAILAGTVTANGLPVVPAEQHPIAGSFDPDANVLVGLESEFASKPKKVDLVYKHAAVISRVCFTGIPDDLTIYGVQINAANAIAGAAKSVDYTNGTVDFSDASEKTISLIYDETPSYSDGKFDAYFVAIPGTDVQINDIKLITDKGTYVKKNNSGSKTGFDVNKLKSVNVNSPSLVSSEKCYVKVTTAPSDWSGTYLIVDESAGKAFDENANSYASTVTINDGKVLWDETVAKYQVAISPSSVSGMYDVKTVTGKYMYSYDSGKTVLNSSSNKTSGSSSNTYYNSLSINGGNVTMFSTRTGSGGSVNYFGYVSSTSENPNSKNFGYKENATTRTVQLYKLQEGATPPLNQTLSFDQPNPSIDIAKQTIFQQVVEGAKTSVTYSISAIPSDAATIDATTGQVTAMEECTATITATAAASNMYQGASASYTLTVIDGNKKYYRKVSIEELSDLTSGTYLLQYSSTSNKYVFDASNSRNNYRTTVTISDEKIESSTSVANAQVTFEAVSGSNNKFYVHTSAGYLGISSNSIKFSDTKTEFTLALSSGQISMKTGNYNLRYSSSSGFSYSTSSSAVKFDLYLLDGSKKQSRNLAFAESAVQKNIDDGSFSIAVTGTLDGTTVSYTSSNESVATVDASGKVTLKGVTGTTTITASTEEDDTYSACSASYTLTVIDPNAKYYYTKVTDNLPTTGTWDKVLFVYDMGNGNGYAFKGIFSGTKPATGFPGGTTEKNTCFLDDGNAVLVKITSDGILSTEEVDACSLQMEFNTENKHNVYMSGVEGYFRMLESGEYAGKFVAMSSGGYRMTYTVSDSGTNNVTAKRGNYYFGFNSTNFASQKSEAKFSIYRIVE